MDYNIVPNIPEGTKIQGYNEAPIDGVQMIVGQNRSINQMKYFSLSMLATGGVAPPTTAYRDIVFTGKNGDVKTPYTELFYGGLGAGNEASVILTKRYTINDFYEYNDDATGATNVGGIIKIPIGGIAEIHVNCIGGTRKIKLNVLAGDFFYIQGSSLEFTTTNTNAMIHSNGTRDLELRMQYSGNIAFGEIISFGIFIKIYE